MQDYRRYLMRERGLVESTVGAYLGTARLFCASAKPGRAGSQTLFGDLGLSAVITAA